MICFIMFVNFFVFPFLIHVLILFVACNEFVGEDHFDTKGFLMLVFLSCV
jgi:hypothetical protein